MANLMRSGKLKQCALAYIYGDPLTGRRETSLTRLSKLYGASLEHLSRVRAEDEWDKQAEEAAKGTSLSVIRIDAKELSKQVLGDRNRALSALEIARESFDRALEVREGLEKAGKDWDLARERYYSLAGITVFMEADAVRLKEIAKLQAKASMKEPDDGEDQGKIVPV